MLTYLAVHIRHEGNPLGIAGISLLPECLILGNIVTAIFKDEKCETSRLNLEKAIQEFNWAFSNFGHQIGLRTFDRVEGI